MIGRLDRYAVASDKHWAKQSLKIADFVTPGLEMKYFESEEEEQALQWLRDS